MRKKRKVLFGTGLGVLGLVLFSCGHANITPPQNKVEGNVRFSKVEGLKVCAEESGKCSYTDKNGHFVVYTYHALPQMVDIEIPAEYTYVDENSNKTKTGIGGLLIGKFKVEQNNQTITAKLLANDDNKLAYAIGGLIHALGGDDTGKSDYVSLGGVRIFAIEDENGEPIKYQNGDNLADIIKKYQNITIRFKKGSKEGSVSIDYPNQKVSLCEGGECKELSYAPYDWLWVWVIGADNDLSDTAKEFVRDLGKIKIPANVKVVVIEDTKGSEGIEEYTTNDKEEKLDTNNPNKKEELDLGDKNTFYEVIKDKLSKYPAKYKGLIITSKGYPYKYVLTDENDADKLYTNELREALKDLKVNDGERFNVVALNWKNLGNLEAMWSIANYTDYIIGSEVWEEDKNGEEHLMSSLAKWIGLNADTTPQNLEGLVADVGENSTVAIAMVDRKSIQMIGEKLDEFAQKVDLSNDTVRKLIKTARENATAIPVEDEDGNVAKERLIDLYSFMKQLEGNFTEAKDIVQVIETISKFVVIGNSTNGTYEGISVYFPLNKTEDDSDYYCNETNPCLGGEYYNPFTSTHWDEFIQKYLSY
jgi:hypothetical protein